MSFPVSPLVGRSYYKAKENNVVSVSNLDTHSLQMLQKVQAREGNKDSYKANAQDRLSYGSGPLTASLSDKVVTVDKEHYENLLRIAQQFENVKRSLLGGGVSKENFDVLANEYTAPPPPAETRSSHSPNNSHYSQFLGPRAPLAVFRTNAPVSTSYSGGRDSDSSPTSSSLDEGILDGDNEINSPAHVVENKPFSDEDDQQPRTVELRNLPDRVTHLDLTNAIRGGALLEIYLRYNNYSARVAFAEATAARAFLERAQRYGFYIGSKRADVSWSDRPFILRPYIKQNIQHGASRNLAIHNTNPNITAALIREHLDHIHNLVVVDIKLDYKQAIAHVSTNSVHNAMFARSCMKSRAAYKGMRIEFEADECAWPYGDEQLRVPSYQQQQQHQQKGNPAVAGRKSKQDYHYHRPIPKQHLSNRFEMLRVGSGSDSDYGSETETENA